MEPLLSVYLAIEEKTMRKILCLLLILLLVLSLPSCGGKYHTEGIENYATISNSFEVDKYLLPSEDFIRKFEYINADYWHDQKFLVYEKSFAYFVYSPEVYQAAMKFTKDVMVFLSDISFEVNGYTFLQRDPSVLYSNTEKYPVDFPEWFWMMFYSEERNVIGFLGYYCQPTEQKIRPDEDFEGFIRYEFPEYDWDA